MIRLSLLIAPIALLLLAGCNDGGQTTAEQPATTPIVNQLPVKAEPALPKGSGFDFYVLSLSWSPAYCASEGRGADQRQCGAAKPFGFIVHGLWPQYERGYPDYCSTEMPQRSDIDRVLDLTPSPGLLRHEWEKHGSCSGLSPHDYFAVMRAARERVLIPSQFSNPRRAFSLSAQSIEQAFARANPGMSAQGIAVDCQRGDFREIRICMTPSLEFRACPEVDRAGCRNNSISIEPIQ